ncbi:MAG: ATP-binding protein [Pseudanabaenaceae cyanobacterium bins.68]|nr:ATP-binding protein [Pseudanabaenaceae cyanobacterium bins.68]
MALIKSASLRVTTDLEQAHQVQEWFKQFNALPRLVMMQCELVLIELFANVIQHAHANLPATTPVDIEATLTTDMIEIKIWDCGQSFDLGQAIAAKKAAEARATTLESLDTGGRGLLITDKLADQLQYDRASDGRNCLLFRKQVQSLSQTAQTNLI